MGVGRRSKCLVTLTNMKLKPFFKLALVLGMGVHLGCVDGVGQGLYAVTRRTRIHPGLGVFVPPVTNVAVASLPLPNSFPQSAANTFAGSGSASGSAVGRPQSPEAQADAARKTLEFQLKRSKEGSAYAQFDLGLRYLNGDGVVADRGEALRLLGESAKQGNTQAAKKLAELTSSK